VTTRVPSAAAELPTPVGDLSLTPSTVLWALAVVVTTFLCSRWASAAALRLGHRLQNVQDDLALRAARLVRYFVLVIGAGAVLAVLGADVQPVLVAVLIMAGAALLMLRGIADNLGAGLVIQTRRPVRLGDLVESNGWTGRVRDLNSRAVVLVTRDGRTVHLPNGLVMGAPLVNHSRRGAVRSEVVVEVRQPGLDVATIGSTILSSATSARGVLDDPGPRALTTLLAHQRAVLVLQVWHEPGEAHVVCSRVARTVHEALAAAGTDAVASWPPAPHVVLGPPPDGG